MILRHTILALTLIACCCLSIVAHAQDFSETVLPITVLKVGISQRGLIRYKPSRNPLSYVNVETEFGTGFCVDPACRFIGTNYHVAMNSRPRKIKGERVIQQYLATGPDDEGATVNEGPSGTKYNLGHDLAIFELRHSLPHHHGVAFSLDDLHRGQEINIYAYPKESINPIRHLMRFHGRFKGETTTGLLAFEYSLSADQTIRPGASGGIVVDSGTQQILGILNGTARNDEHIALAVPVRSLVEFVSKVLPHLAPSIFPSAKGIFPVADFYPKFVLPSANGLEHRAVEPPDVKMLRSKAQLLADSMRNFIAVQTLAWGAGDKEPAAMAAYEVRVLDGYQRFREYPDGKKQLQDIPFPPLDNVFVPGTEWSELPEMVGTKLQLRIHQAPDAVANGQWLKVFQYKASVEDGLCTWRTAVDYGFFKSSKIFEAAVYGEVWTDENTNILRISEHCELPDKSNWKDYQAVVTYGWLKRADEPLRLIPVTISAYAEHKRRVYWCRGQFTHYQVFTTRARIVGN